MTCLSAPPGVIVAMTIRIFFKFMKEVDYAPLALLNDYRFISRLHPELVIATALTLSPSQMLKHRMNNPVKSNLLKKKSHHLIMVPAAIEMIFGCLVGILPDDFIQIFLA